MEITEAQPGLPYLTLDIIKEIIRQLHPGYHVGLMTVSKIFCEIVIEQANVRYIGYGRNKGREIVIRGDLYNFIYHESFINLRLAYRDPEMILVTIIRKESVEQVSQDYSFEDEIRYALESNRLDVVKEMLAEIDDHREVDVSLVNIATTGSIEVVQAYFAKGYHLTIDALVIGCYKSGNPEMINWLDCLVGTRHRQTKLRECLMGLCYGGHYEMLKRFMIDNAQDIKAISRAVYNAAYEGGSLDVIKHLRSYQGCQDYQTHQDYRGIVNSYCVNCCASGKIEIFEYMRSYMPFNCTRDNYNHMIMDAIVAGSFALVSRLLDEIKETRKLDKPIDINWDNIINYAEEEGMLDVVDLIIEYLATSSPTIVRGD